MFPVLSGWIEHNFRTNNVKVIRTSCKTCNREEITIVYCHFYCWGGGLPSQLFLPFVLTPSLLQQIHNWSKYKNPSINNVDFGQNLISFPSTIFSLSPVWGPEAVTETGTSVSHKISGPLDCRNTILAQWWINLCSVANSNKMDQEHILHIPFFHKADSSLMVRTALGQISQGSRKAFLLLRRVRCATVCYWSPVSWILLERNVFHLTLERNGTNTDLHCCKRQQAPHGPWDRVNLNSSSQFPTDSLTNLLYSMWAFGRWSLEEWRSSFALWEGRLWRKEINFPWGHWI